MLRLRACECLILGLLTQVSLAQTVRQQHFDQDPNWEGWNNHVTPEHLPTVKQDFGFSQTNFAGTEPGEMGGVITRASEPAFYADKIDPITLDQQFSASGSFALTRSTSGGGVFFGFLRAQQPGAGGRPIASLGMNIDTEQSGGRLAVRLITADNQSCGTFITPFIPGKFRPTSIRNDGTRYNWTLSYDPQAAEGRGSFTFTIHSRDDATKGENLGGLSDQFAQEALLRYPNVNKFVVDLPEGFRQKGATFDHFGLMNMMKPGGQMAIYFDDLKYADRAQDFSNDPGWDASGNRKTYQGTDVGGAHNFGFSDTNYAGGKAGEIGGTFWRSDKWGYYADPIGKLTFDDRLEAHGKVILMVGAPDSDMCFGWFGARRDGEAPDKSGPFLGIKVGGPTRVGHYFLPACAVNATIRSAPDKGPVLQQAKAFEWSMVYDPSANDGQGAITATLGEESVTHNLRRGEKAAAKDLVLDHFGIFATGPGGQIVKLYLDDLNYTAGK
jgi:hypothetical protein